MQRQIFYPLAILVISLLAGCKKEPVYNFGFATNTPAANGKTYTAPEIAGFKQMMLEDGATVLTVKKWDRDTVNVYLTDSSNSLLTAELPVIFEDIKTASGNHLFFRRTTDSLAPVKIYFTGKAAFLQKFPAFVSPLTGANDGRTGYCYIWWGGDFKIYQSVIFIDKEKLEATPTQLRYVARHELTHALGFLTHISNDDFSNSVMYYINNGMTQYAVFDKRMIGLLYNPTMTAGLTGEALNRLLLDL